jgi:hypothetical protein
VILYKRQHDEPGRSLGTKVLETSMRDSIPTAPQRLIAARGVVEFAIDAARHHPDTLEALLTK